jgi:hypothetical protein
MRAPFWEGLLLGLLVGAGLVLTTPQVVHGWRAGGRPPWRFTRPSPCNP